MTAKALRELHVRDRFHAPILARNRAVTADLWARFGSGRLCVDEPEDRVDETEMLRRPEVIDTLEHLHPSSGHRSS